jgi:23S rRNA pseudouridine2457 synthase
MPVLYLFNKPYGVLSQFSPSEGEENLSAFIKQPHIYPCGRLDKDSEGLLLLSDYGPLQHLISHPRHKQKKTYLVQVEGMPQEAELHQLRKGIQLKDGLTKPATVRTIPEPPLWPRTPPIRARLSIPDSWIELVIAEGKNRQIRRMTAAAGYPTLRLIRTAIGPWSLKNFGLEKPGRLLRLDYTIEELAKLLRARVQQLKKTTTVKRPQHRRA